MASALTQTVAVAGGRGGSLLSVRVVAVALLVVVFAVGGMLLSQRAYRGGGLGAPLAVVNLANPLAAAAIGAVLLGERLQGGPAGLLLAGAGACVAAWGVVLLTRAPAAPTGAPAARIASAAAELAVPGGRVPV